MAESEVIDAVEPGTEEPEDLEPLTAGAVLYQRQGLTIAAMLMALALLLSAAANLYQLWLSGSIHYITVGSGVRMSRPGHIPAQGLREVAEGFVTLIGNGTARGIRENWQDAERHMTGEAREAFSRVASEQLPLIESGDITLTTERVKATAIERKSAGSFYVYEVTVKTMQYVRYGTLGMGGVEAEFKVTLLPGNKGSVHGLWIADFFWPPLAVPEGALSGR